MAQALVRFLANQYVERDGIEQRFFAGCWGIFGHGNVGGIGQALHERPDDLRYFQARNEQAMVHAAHGYAKMRDRLATFACTTSIGPGATNMVGDVSVNDVFRPVSRYFDRILRAEQIVPAALAAMRVLVSPAETGAVTLALPQDVQAEAFEVPDDFVARRTWHIERRLPEAAAIVRAAELIGAAKRPLIVAGGGVIYSSATESLRTWVDVTGIPVAETQAGKGALPFDHPLALGAIGVTGSSAANRIAREADLVIGIGTRWTDFTTASKTAFQDPNVRFINVNVAEFDAQKHAGLALVGDARAAIDALAGWSYTVEPVYRDKVERLVREWSKEVDRLYSLGHTPLPAQSEVIGAVNEAAGPRDVVVCAAGSLPGDLHKLWRTRDVKGYHVEYGFSTMGYEIAGGLGVKMAAPDREVYVLVGDGSYLMLAQELVTAVQEGIKIVVVVVDNHGFASIGSLSRSLGSQGFGTHYRYRKSGSIGLDREGPQGDTLPIDLAANAASLGAVSERVRTIADLRAALTRARRAERPYVITIEADRYESVPAYGSWWDVAPAEVSGLAEVRAAREAYETGRKRARRQLRSPE